MQNPMDISLGSLIHETTAINTVRLIEKWNSGSLNRVGLIEEVRLIGYGYINIQ